MRNSFFIAKASTRHHVHFYVTFIIRIKQLKHSLRGTCITLYVVSTDRCISLAVFQIFTYFLGSLAFGYSINQYIFGLFDDILACLSHESRFIAGTIHLLLNFFLQ